MQLVGPRSSRYVVLVLDDLDVDLGGLPAEVVRAATIDAAAAALAAGRRYSAVVAAQLAPEIAAAARRAGVPVLVMSPAARAWWLERTLPLLATPVPRADQAPSLGPASASAPASAANFASPPGCGASVPLSPPGCGSSTPVPGCGASVPLSPPGCGSSTPVPGCGALVPLSPPGCGSSTPVPVPGPGGAHMPPLGSGPEPGRLVALCGPGGTGVSVVAKSFAAAARHPVSAIGPESPLARVVLADFARRADQAFLHGFADFDTGVLDLADAARYRAIGPADVCRHTIALVDGRRLLPGLRRPAHWTAVAPAAFDSVLAALVASCDLVVADVTGDVEGEGDTGSIDIEERNHAARRTLGAADVVVVVGAAGANGARRQSLFVDELLDHGVDPARILPVVNRTSRQQQLSPVRRLPARPLGLPTGSGGQPPPVAVAPLAAAVAELLTVVAAAHRPPPLVAVTPGSLGCRTS